MKSLSNIETALTHHIRIFLCKHFSNETIKKVSFIIALFSCLLDASVVTFSIFTPSFMEDLHYDQFMINIISGAIAIGMYLTLPVLGYLADLHGPVILAALSIIMFCPGYLLAAYTYKYKMSYIHMAVSFCLIGCATSACYFCSLLTCAKIYPERKGLSISVPVTFYGLSSLILSGFVFKLPLFQKDSSINPDLLISDATNKTTLDTYKVFVGLSIMYLILGIVNWVSSVFVTIEKHLLFSKLNCNYPTQQTNETTPLLNDILEDNDIIDTSESDSFLNPDQINDHNKNFKNFLNDNSMYLLYGAFFFLAGPLEFFITNIATLINIVGIKDNDIIGSILINSNETNEISLHVTLFSLLSTISRLVMGYLSDYFLNKPKDSRFKVSVITLLICCIFSAIVGFLLITLNSSFFSLITIFVGSAYGGIFTLFPTIAATVWGVEILGSTWGLFLSAPALGSLFFGLLYAYEYDHYCKVSISKFQNDFIYCLTFPFSVMTLGFITSLILVIICWKTVWRARQIDI